MSELRKVIELAGGLANQSDLARRWGMSRQAVHDMTQRPDFPAPATTIGDRPVWSVEECDRWRGRRAA